MILMPVAATPMAMPMIMARVPAVVNTDMMTALRFSSRSQETHGQSTGIHEVTSTPA